MPEGAIYVGRPTKWGNPFAVVQMAPVMGLKSAQPTWAVVGGDVIVRFDSKDLAVANAVDRFRRWLRQNLTSEQWLKPLRGHDLACFCPLDQPCHADVLLEIANR